jgi:ribose-phosphate pyrophosphokinase
MMIIFSFGNSQNLAKKIAKTTMAKLGKIEYNTFPDEELYIRFMNKVDGEKVVIVESMFPNPNLSLLKLYFAGRTAKSLGAKKVIAVIPYLGFMRQDKRFKDGECISSREMAHLINSSFDSIITIDPHLHRIKNMTDIFHIERKKLSANSLIAEYIKKHFNQKTAIIAGPDIESSQWAKAIADSIHYDSVIFLKERKGPRNVKINVTMEMNWNKKDIIIIDDIVSSGHTMIEAIKEIKKRNPNSVNCICVHGLFVEGAYEKILKTGINKIVSTNTIEHKSNKIDVSGIIAEEILKYD